MIGGESPRPGVHSPTMKVALANMRSFGVRTMRVYCANAPRCWHSATIDADRWPDETALHEIEPRFVCTRCGAIGAELRPNWPPGPLTFAYGKYGSSQVFACQES